VGDDEREAAEQAASFVLGDGCESDSEDSRN
jgi:hypothetical protein